MEWSDGQLACLKAAAEGRNLFITGQAGTGKSRVVGAITRALSKRYGPGAVYVTATTGCAASLMGGGATTLHRWAGLGLARDSVPALLRRLRRGRADAMERWAATRCLVIDEVSMLPGDLWKRFDAVARAVRNRDDVPWGGIQVIACGDFAQLPPVNKRDEPPDWAFDTESWRHCFGPCGALNGGTTVYLQRVWRQEGAAMLAALADIRLCASGRDLRMDTLRLLRARLRAGAGGELSDEDVAGLRPARLCPRRDEAARLNAAMLSRLDADTERVYRARDEHPSMRGGGAAAAAKATAEMDRTLQAPRVLRLRVGARVMMLRNSPGGHYNGRLGTVVDYNERGDPVVEWDDRPGRENATGVERARFEMPAPPRVRGRRAAASTREQLPLMLAWALTIHKSQGVTLTAMRANLSGAFAPGQAYVALSRVRSVEGLVLDGFDAARIYSDAAVRQYYARLTSTSTHFEDD